MSTVVSICLAILYVGIHAYREHTAKARHKEATALQDRIEKEQIALRLRIEEIDDTLRASPFVTHPTTYRR